MKWATLILICLVFPTVSAQVLDNNYFKVISVDTYPEGEPYGGDIVTYDVYLESVGKLNDNSFLYIYTELDSPLMTVIINGVEIDTYDLEMESGELYSMIQNFYLPSETWNIRLELSGYAPDVTVKTSTPGLWITADYEISGEYVMEGLVESDLTVRPAPGSGYQKYDYIEKHVMAEGQEDFGNYDPINPINLFYPEEGKAVLITYFNRLDGKVTLDFYLYKDGEYITSYTDGWTEGDGRRWYYRFDLYFADIPGYDLIGNWRIDTYIDDEYAFSDEFSIIESTPDTEYWPPFIAGIIIYLLFALPYIIVQKVRKNNINPKAIVFGGLVIWFVFLLAILGEGDVSNEELVMFMFGAVFTAAVLHPIVSRMQTKVKDEPVPIVKTIEHETPAHTEKEPVKKKCPYCGGKLSELNYFKLKSGNDVICEYCNEIIEG